jgi:outer membrane receptor protein involved in Fe transport
MFVYKHAERVNGENYKVMDIRASYKLNKFDVSISGNNLFDEIYSETNLVQMPGRNMLVGLSYSY